MQHLRGQRGTLPLCPITRGPPLSQCRVPGDATSASNDPPVSTIELAEIEAAASRIQGLVHRTPVLSASALGSRAGVRLLLKCESFQKTGSFKPRGALNIVLSLSDSERKRGLITVSAGNHAQAVAWAAQRAGARCAVVMPAGAPRSKIDAVRGYGGEVILHDERATLFERLEAERERSG